MVTKIEKSCKACKCHTILAKEEYCLAEGILRRLEGDEMAEKGACKNFRPVKFAATKPEDTQMKLF